MCLQRTCFLPTILTIIGQYSQKKNSMWRPSANCFGVIVRHPGTGFHVVNVVSHFPFQHYGLRLPIWGRILTFWRKQGSSYIFYSKSSHVWFRIYWTIRLCVNILYTSFRNKVDYFPSLSEVHLEWSATEMSCFLHQRNWYTAPDFWQSIQVFRFCMVWKYDPCHRLQMSRLTRTVSTALSVMTDTNVDQIRRRFDLHGISHAPSSRRGPPLRMLLAFALDMLKALYLLQLAFL